MVQLIDLRQFGFHVVAQIIKTQLIVGRIGDVRRIGLCFFGLRLLGVNDAGRHAQRAIDLAHPFRITSCQIIVHGHDMNAAPRQCIQIGRESGHEGLALTRFHLGNVATV